MHLENLELTIDKQQIHEYYFIKYIYNTENWLFPDYSGVIDEIGGYKKQFTSEIYEIWLREWSFKKHRELISALKSYIGSTDFRLEHSHFNRDQNNYLCNFVDQIS